MYFHCVPIFAGFMVGVGTEDDEVLEATKAFEVKVVPELVGDELPADVDVLAKLTAVDAIRAVEDTADNPTGEKTYRSSLFPAPQNWSELFAHSMLHCDGST